MPTRARVLKRGYELKMDDECIVSAAIWVMTIVSMHHPFDVLLGGIINQREDDSIELALCRVQYEV